MGEAILAQLLATELYQPDQVTVSDPSVDRQAALRDRYGVHVTGDNHQALAQSTVVLAIKPQVFDRVVADLATDAIPATTCMISILAGMPLARLETAFPTCAVVRAMPNTPAQVGAGITAIAAGQRVQPDQLTRARQVLAAVGDVVEVPEYLMDAVTGLSGSGPAYVALMVEALADGGVAAGLPRAIALPMAIQTVRGTTELLAQRNLHPAILKDQVTSPGGTTIAGVSQLETHGFRAALIAAVTAAAQRSQELGQT